MKRVLTIFLAVTMFAVVCLFAAACGDDSGNGSTTTAATETTSATTTAETTSATTGTTSADVTTEATTTGGGDEPPVTVWDGTTKLPGYLNTTFNGKTFLIAARTDESTGGWNNGNEIWVESINNDAVNDAVYTRNKTMHDLYDCNIRVDNEGWANGFNADIASGGGKYIAGCAAYSAGTSGVYYNVLNLGIDFSQSWWDQSFTRDLSCNGKLYLLNGDFALHVMRATWIMFYNKDIYEQNLADEYDIYDLVDNKQWTVDVLLAMCQKVASNNDGAEGLTYSEGADADMLGLMTTTHNYRALYFSCGERFVDKDDSGKMVSAISKSGRGYEVIEKVRQLTCDESYLEIGYSSVHQAMMNGTVLFAGEVLGTLEVVSEAENLRIGIIPQPLYAAGEDYHHYVNNQAAFYLIPTSYADIQTIADFFTLFAAHSQQIVRKAYIEAYSYSYASDDDSARMLDIILNSRVYDPGYHFNFATSGLDGALFSLMGKGGKNSFNSAVKKFDSKQNEAITAYETVINAIVDPV